jgi:outer membrane lipoprotein-sorting protein
MDREAVRVGKFGIAAAPTGYRSIAGARARPGGRFAAPTLPSSGREAPFPCVSRYSLAMMSLISRRAALAASFALLAFPALSAPAPQPALAAEDQALVDRAVAYLQGLAGAKGHFIQTDARQNVTHGTFILQRPGKARFAYDPPTNLVMASNGHVVSVWNQRLKTFESYPLGMTPLSIFLAKEIRLDKGVVVSRVERLGDGFSIVARDAKHQAQGVITLTFSANPVALRGWTITDAQGGATRVSLTDFSPAGPFEGSLFDLKNPYPRTITR